MEVVEYLDEITDLCIEHENDDRMMGMIIFSMIATASQMGWNLQTVDMRDVEDLEDYLDTVPP